MTKLHSTKSNKLKSEFTVTVHLTVDNTLGWEANGRSNFHRAYRSSSNSYIRCWSEAATRCSETSIRNYRGPSYWRHHVFGGMGHYGSCCGVVLWHKYCPAKGWQWWWHFWCLRDYRAEAWKRFALLGMSPSYGRASGLGDIRRDKWCIYWPWSSSI